MSKLIDNLKNYLENTSQECRQKDWQAIKNMHIGYNISNLDMNIPTVHEFMLWNNFPIPVIFKNIDHFGLDAQPWIGQGSYFKFCSFKRQPVFCSYSLHPLLQSIKLYDYAIITDQDDNLLYVFEHGELRSYC